ncbi:MAG: proline--tRNA ligase [Opitutales bacterium]|tara:strand:- start:4720 stop:6243 length:1524 start_codon:yes stop_codon:yes gene_type:complete
MSGKKKNAISPRRTEDYPEWYQQVVRAADLAELSPVRGCMVIKPWGYALWENMQAGLDGMIKATGHKNAYFPLFIPKSFLEKEAKHVDGFAKECAVVTHSRLEAGPDGELVPASPLEEPLIVRPTSETIIGEMYSRWVQSYRDLPLLINQWANVVRWEMRTRMFLRTTEFLWQEGHTVHATEDEAVEETLKMLDVYADFVENYMAVPVIKGEKTESERFPGAVSTYTIEALMQDCKALQAGTSHFLGQHFSKASDIQFLDREGNKAYAWTTSWGITTRLIGALVMVHGDDDGLRMPPRLAPTHVVLLPVLHKEADENEILDYCHSLKQELGEQTYHGRRIEVEVDARDLRGGEKMWQWIKKGVPLYVEVGPREVAENALYVGRRDKGPKERASQSRDLFVSTLHEVLDEMQSNLYKEAQAFREAHTVKIDTRDDFYQFFSQKEDDVSALHGGFALTHWAYDPEVEERLKKDLKVTVRCIPLQGEEASGICPFTGKPSPRRVIFAKSY